VTDATTTATEQTTGGIPDALDRLLAVLALVVGGVLVALGVAAA
jgi:hypothetical protein